MSTAISGTGEGKDFINQDPATLSWGVVVRSVSFRVLDFAPGPHKDGSRSGLQHGSPEKENANVDLLNALSLSTVFTDICTWCTLKTTSMASHTTAPDRPDLSTFEPGLPVSLPPKEEFPGPLSSEKSSGSDESPVETDSPEEVEPEFKEGGYGWSVSSYSPHPSIAIAALPPLTLLTTS